MIRDAIPAILALVVTVACSSTPDPEPASRLGMRPVPFEEIADFVRDHGTPHVRTNIHEALGLPAKDSAQRTACGKGDVYYGSRSFHVTRGTGSVILIHAIHHDTEDPPGHGFLLDRSGKLLKVAEWWHPDHIAVHEGDQVKWFLTRYERELVYWMNWYNDLERRGIIRTIKERGEY